MNDIPKDSIDLYNATPYEIQRAFFKKNFFRKTLLKLTKLEIEYAYCEESVSKLQDSYINARTNEFDSYLIPKYLRRDYIDSVRKLKKLKKEIEDLTELIYKEISNHNRIRKKEIFSLATIDFINTLEI